MNFETTKNLGGVGALLMFIGVLIPFVPYVGNIISILGLVILLFALYGFAGIYKERSIFNNSIYGVIAGVVGVMVSVVVGFVAIRGPLVEFLQKMFPGWNGTDWAALSGMTPDTANINPSDVIPLLGSLLVAFLIAWVFIIIVAFLFRKSLKTMSVKSGVGLFGTAGLILLIGAVLAIIFVGFLLMWIAVLLVAIAFFMMKRPEEAVEMASPPPPAPV
ncbi:MAG: DUF996 domain-containing protein [Candidatus Bathyarchaeota archaeon]|nr:DUF996 domain-containing protein [Candidatus Bathyarchaeota archaeon]